MIGIGIGCAKNVALHEGASGLKERISCLRDRIDDSNSLSSISFTAGVPSLVSDGVVSLVPDSDCSLSLNILARATSASFLMASQTCFVQMAHFSESLMHNK